MTGGLEALSLRRLARQLGVTAPAVSTGYVRSKQDLLGALAEIEIDRLAARFEEVDGANPLDPIERIRAHSRAYVAYARDNPELFRVMLLAPPSLPASGLPAEEARRPPWRSQRRPAPSTMPSPRD